MSTVLFLTKDLASNPAIPLAQMLQGRGHAVHVVCEGLSSALWYDAGFRPYFVGTVNATVEPFTLDAGKVLEKLQPSLIVACEGNPIHLEEQFGLAANKRGIPLAFLEDFWNGFIRSQATPDIILTIDAYAAKLAREARPSCKVVVVGSGQTAAKVSVSSALAVRLDELRKKHGPAIVFIGGEATEDVALVIECMKQTQGFLIPRFHPKHKTFVLEGGCTREDVWREMLQEIDGRVVWTNETSTSEVIAAGDIVCSGMGSSLIEAVSIGKPAVVLQTPEVSTLLQKIVGLGIFPLVPLGLAYMIEQPADLGSFTKVKGDPGVVLVPYSAEKAYQALAP